MAIISMLSGAVKYSIFCFLFLLMGIIRFMSLPTYYMCRKRSSPKMHEAIKNESAEWQTHLRISYSGVNVPLSSHVPFRFVNYHMSGIPKLFQDISPVQRLIPTYVGQTYRSPASLLRIPIHSHSRGTSAIRNRQFHDDRDSFPRMWDK